MAAVVEHHKEDSGVNDHRRTLLLFVSYTGVLNASNFTVVCW